MKKIGVFVGEEMWTFFHEIYDDLQTRYQTEVYREKTYNTPLLYGRLNRWAFDRQVRAMLRRNDVCFFEWASNLLMRASQMPKTCAIVARLHSFELYEWAPQINWDAVDKIILISRAMQRQFTSLYPEQEHKTVVIYNGRSLDAFRPPDKKDFNPFDLAQDKPFDLAQDKPFDLAQDKPFDLAQDKPFDLAQDKPFDLAQDKPFDLAQDKPFDLAQDKPFDLAQDKPFDLAQDKPFDLTQDKFRLGMLCHIKPIKRIYETILMLYQLRQKGYQATLSVAGEAQSAGDMRYRAAVYRLVSKLKLDSAVSFDGYVSDAPGWLQNIDIFISNSFWEGQQVALLEAMASGCYCLSHFWAGAEEMLPPENLYITENDLQEKIIAYSKLPEAKREAQRAQLRRLAIERFDIERTKAEIRHVIEQVSRGRK